MSLYGDNSVANSSRWGGASTIRNLGLLGSRKESVGTMDSFTEDQHNMTRAELEYQPSEEESELNDEIILALRERMVLGLGSTTFGLKWECGTVDQSDYVLGGWLSQVTNKTGFLSSNPTLVNGQTRFCVLDDKAKEFQQCLDATLKVRRAIQYDEMHSVRPRKLANQPVWYLEIYGRSVKWELMPIKQSDRDLVMRWTCALQLRSNTYDASLTRDVTRANKAVLWTQSQYRMWKAKVKVQRKRERQNHLVYQMASMFGYYDMDEDDNDEDGFGAGEPAPGYVESVLEVASNLWGTVGSWLGLGGGAIAEEEEENGHVVSLDMRRVSISVQSKDDLPLLLDGQVEDEIWENQRWTPAVGWTSKTLGKTERCAFTDRLGRGNFPAPQDIPLPTGYHKVVAATGSEHTGFDLDLSGVNRAKCDAEGFTYSFDWPLLDAALAKGVHQIHHGTKDFVRRRRWYRIRQRAEDHQNAVLLSTTEPILAQGWLGMKTSQGRWHSRQFCLVRAGLTIGAETLRFPALVQFRVAFRDYDAVTNNGGTDGAQWRALTEKQVSVLELPPKTCTVDETVATAQFAGHFAIVIDGIQRTFSASSAAERQRWSNAVTQACKDAAKQARPRTMRLVGGAFETACYPTIIMDSLLVAPVDAVEEAFFASPSVHAAVNVRSGNTNVVSEAWDTTKQSKRITYLNREKLRVEETWQRARTEPGEGFIVDRRIECPEAQFGDEYAIKLRFVLCRCEIQGEFGCRVLCSVDIEYLKPTMMVGFIASEAKKNNTVNLRDVWLPCVVTFLQNKGVLTRKTASLLDTQTKITWGAQGQVTGSSSKLGKKPASLPRDESEKIEVGRW